MSQSPLWFSCQLTFFPFFSRGFETLLSLDWHGALVSATKILSAASGFSSSTAGRYFARIIGETETVSDLRSKSG
jgi:hypothetical protein